MADQSTDWAAAAKWLGGLVAGLGGIRAYFKARNTNYADRIARLERTRREDLQAMSEVRAQAEELNIRVSSIETRTRRLEVGHTDLERVLRDELGALNEGTQRLMDLMDRRMRHDAATFREQPEPHAER